MLRNNTSLCSEAVSPLLAMAHQMQMIR